MIVEEISKRRKLIETKSEGRFDGSMMVRRWMEEIRHWTCRYDEESYENYDLWETHKVGVKESGWISLTLNFMFNVQPHQGTSKIIANEVNQNSLRVLPSTEFYEAPPFVVGSQNLEREIEEGKFSESFIFTTFCPSNNLIFVNLYKNPSLNAI